MAEAKVFHEGPIVTRDDALAQGLKRYFTGSPCSKGHVAQRKTSNWACLACKSEHVATRRKSIIHDGRLVCDGLPATWSEARSTGCAHYFTGKPCRAGHLSPRLTSTSNCVQCVSDLSVKIQMRDKDRTYARAKAWRDANPDKVSAIRRKSWVENDGAARLRAWRKANPEKASSYARNRRALRLGAEGSFSAEEYEALLERQGFRCVYCSSSLTENGHHADHIKPLSKGGSNHIWNIQALCPDCNVRKWTFDCQEFQARLAKGV